MGLIDDSKNFMDKTSHAIESKLSAEVHSLRVEATSVASSIKGFGHKGERHSRNK
jgi:hypothetical protein